MNTSPYEVIGEKGRALVKMWTRGVPVEDGAKARLRRAAAMPFVYKWLAAMPDVHQGRGATIGSVIPTKGAIIPAAVGVDIGCGMMAARTDLAASDLPDHLGDLRAGIEAAVPHGRSADRRSRDVGSWGEVPGEVVTAWSDLEAGFRVVTAKYPKLEKTNHVVHLGTLGTGNHFIEVCLDQDDRVWFMLHSGSRGIGNAIGRTFIELAK